MKHLNTCFVFQLLHRNTSKYLIFKKHSLLNKTLKFLQRSFLFFRFQSYQVQYIQFLPNSVNICLSLYKLGWATICLLNLSPHCVLSMNRSGRNQNFLSGKASRSFGSFLAKFPQIWYKMDNRKADVHSDRFPTHMSPLLKNSIRENMFSNLQSW